MKENTLCYLVNFDEWTRQACIESLPEDAFSTITIKNGNKEKSYPAWQTTIGFARQIRFNGQESNKPITLNIVVKCSKNSEALRFALASEWVISLKKRKSLARAVSSQIKKIQARKQAQFRGRLGTIK
jgi:hypothetical protein